MLNAYIARETLCNFTPETSTMPKEKAFENDLRLLHTIPVLTELSLRKVDKGDNPLITLPGVLNISRQYTEE